MMSSLPIEFRGKLISLPVDIDYHRQGDQVHLLSVRVSGTDILGLLDRTEIIALRASVLTREFANRPRGCGATRALVAAQQYREERVDEQPYLGGGVVVVNRAGTAAGWMDRLRDPQNWEPGCRAVAVDGTQWLAVGGNDSWGAGSWELAVGDKPHLTPGMIETAQDEQEAALRFSEAQKGVRHVR